MRYKVGDRVKIRKDLAVGRIYGKEITTEGMKRYFGEEATIDKVNSCGYNLKVDAGKWKWTDEMLEKIEKKPKKKNMKYKIGDKVVVKKDLKEFNSYGDAMFLPVQTLFRGKVVTITRDNCVADVYTIKEDNETYSWTDEMFEGIAKELSPQKQVAEMFGCQLKEVPQDDDYAIEGKPTLANDPVSHPSHYTDGRIEVIDFIQDKHLDFARGNVVKYVCRAGKKGGSKAKEIEDLKKAKQYCEFAIRDLEGRV